MSSKNLFWTAGIAAVLYGVYKTASLSKNISFFQYSLSGLKFRINNILQPEVIFSLQVYNPNQTSVPINDFFGVIKKDDRILANFKNVSAINLGGKESQTIDISAKVNVISVVMQMIKGQKINNVTIDAMLKTGFFDMPIRKDVSLSSLAGIGEIKRMERRIHQRKSVRCNCNNAPGFLQYQKMMHNTMLQGSVV